MYNNIVITIFMKLYMKAVSSAYIEFSELYDIKSLLNIEKIFRFGSYSKV